MVNGRFDCYSPSTSRQFGKFLLEYTSIRFKDVKWAYNYLCDDDYTPIDSGECVCVNDVCVTFISDFNCYFCK